MKTLFLKDEFAYDGTQLRSLFGYLDHKVQGNSIISWIGACNIGNDHMIDGEDLLAGETIAGDKMVHFIIERFETQLFGAVALQRLMASIVMDVVRAHVNDNDVAAQFRRAGDDIYFGPGKLSISIATLTPMSALIHFAVNVTNAGTPVTTASLEDINMNAEAFAREVLKRVADEVADIETATVKVRWAK